MSAFVLLNLGNYLFLLELLILYIFLTISLSFLCSILEAVLLSINTTFIKIEIKEGKKYEQKRMQQDKADYIDD